MSDVCPRCRRPLIRNHDELLCLAHGQIYQPTQAWETAPDTVVAGRWRVAHDESTVPWTVEERELWRRAEANQPVAAPGRPATEGRCRYCGTPFVAPARQGTRPRYCEQHRGDKWRDLVKRGQAVRS